MKKIILSVLLCVFSFFVFASDVSDLLLEAQTAYESGDVYTAIQKIDSAKSIMEKEQLSSSANDYVEVASWDIIKIKSADYLGKKVIIKAKFIGINSDGTVYLIEISPSNSYEPSLVDKTLTLKKYEYYNFYGTVVSDYLGPKLFIEAIN
ncbi:MAG: hypothetical protein SPH83_01585 [Treponema sp.]|nr:hypothetical protein [Spirochaetales bacterium]MDY6189170.1 hypothetical protein [Treponema sp.]